MKTNILKIALPAGSLKEATFGLLRKAGYTINCTERSYSPTINDAEISCSLIRAQEIPRYLAEGKFDLGITGKDWIEESGKQFQELAALTYSKKGLNPTRLVLAVPKDSTIDKVEDLQDKVIATELVMVTKRFLEAKGVKAAVEFSWGATESKAPYLADAIADIVDSGKSIQENNLRIIATVLESTPRVIVNAKSYQDQWKRRKSEQFAKLLNDTLYGIKS
jgi:ATP phosphoribosyltransferase